MVAIPTLLAVVAYGSMWISGHPNGLGLILFLPLSAYYLPPTILFGEPYFIGGIGAGPTGVVGTIIGCISYSLISLVIASIISKASESFGKESD